MMDVISRGGNAVMDSDFVDPLKRASLIARARRIGAKVVFVRTHSDYDLAAARIIEDYKTGKGEEFFSGASSKYKGDERSKGGIVKLREMDRRKSLHYQWGIDLLGRTGGRHTLRTLGIPFLSSIDTTDPEEAKRLVDEAAAKIVRDF